MTPPSPLHFLAGLAPRLTPDEMYFGTGGDVPAKLADARQAARQARLRSNRARQCGVCA